MQLCICHHHMLLTSSIITELDSVFDVSQKSRRKCIFDQCLSWHTFAQCHSICPEFCQHLRISFRSFEMLVGLLKESFMVEQEMHHYGVVPLYQNCVSMLHFSIWQLDSTRIYFILSVFWKLYFIIYYGRQLRQLITVMNYGFLGHIPRKGN